MYPSLVLSRVNLSRFDRDIQMIFLRREGAGGILCEGTGRTVGFVEINEYLAIFVRVGVMITTGWIGRVAVGQVHELDEETVVRQFLDYQFMFLSIQFKGDKALHGFIQDRAQDIGHLHDFGGLITGIRGRDAQLFFDGIPLSAGEECGVLLLRCPTNESQPPLNGGRPPSECR